MILNKYPYISLNLNFLKILGKNPNLKFLEKLRDYF